MIRRDPDLAANSTYELIIVGGGVYGVALALEAARRGIAPLLLERGDFGGETSWNTLRIVHGGLRYLQSLDLARHRESVAERRWFLEAFPDLVRPLPCVMPLYARGLRRPSVLRLALAVDGALSSRRNRDLPEGQELPSGRLLSAQETRKRFLDVQPAGLAGAALWYDAAMADSQRLLVEMLHWACACGAVALNYMEALEPRRVKGRLAGVLARDAVTGRRFEFLAPVVVNCAGPWCREVACAFDRDLAELFLPSIAFNLLLDRPPPAQEALALSPSRARARSYFLYPWKGLVLAGTFHAPWVGPRDDKPVSDDLIEQFLTDLNACLPHFNVGPVDVLRVHYGWLPARRLGVADQRAHPVVIHHQAHGGPRGLWSVSGVKFTTARSVAEKTLRLLRGADGESLPPYGPSERPTPGAWTPARELLYALEHDQSAPSRQVEDLVKSESVVHIDDLLLRRTDWGSDPRLGPRIREWVAPIVPARQFSLGDRHQR